MEARFEALITVGYMKKPRIAKDALVEEQAKATALVCPHWMTENGILPIRDQPVRFAVGDPAASSSNAWRVWAQGAGDIYLACRDSFRETKVSLHISGRWRFGFTAEAAAARPDLIMPGSDRAMMVWDKPAEIADGVIQAFKMYFPVHELRVTPEMRLGKKWKNVFFVEEGSSEFTTVLAIYVTRQPRLLIRGLRSFCLGAWALPDGSFAHLFAQGELMNMQPYLKEVVAAGKAQAQKAGMSLPDEMCFQVWGTDSTTGARFIVIAGDEK